MEQIDFYSKDMFHELNSWREDEELKASVKECLDAQHRVGLKMYDEQFKPNPQADYAVSKEALEKILDTDEDISDIRTNTDISNCIVFHTKNLAGSVIDQSLLDLRAKTDLLIIDKLQQVFTGEDSINAQVSGHFWYPDGGFMGWHTNLRKPGWRMYINYAEQPNQSFFRYRDPDSGEIVTCMDQQWNFRLFKITPEKPFWHSVHSNTNRFSLGYMIVKGE